MKAVYKDSTVPEKIAKKKYEFPELIMMENAAATLENAVRDFCCNGKVLILCGKGNNGADGLALARRLAGDFELKLYLFGEPKSAEAEIQYKMTKSVGIHFCSENEISEEILKSSENDILVDCFFGTGFNGDLPKSILKIIGLCNKSKAKKIACDVPSGMKFVANKTVTMGALKTVLFGDGAKDVCGKIICANLGISGLKFRSVSPADAFLLEKQDLKLPWRNEKGFHKGNFGHTAVFAGEKSGAGIIAAIAALNFGSGLVSLVKTQKSDLNQFKISPELMISSEIPEKTTAVCIGSGLGEIDEKTLGMFKNWFCFAKNPACVIDADLLTNPEILTILKLLNSVSGAKIILTPHLKEFTVLCSLCKIAEISVSDLIDSKDSLALKMEISEKFVQKFPSCVLIVKSAITLITAGNNCLDFCAENENSTVRHFICADGGSSLAKAGSGDVLAGMNAALLAQNYTALDAAVTAVESHALAGSSFDAGKGFDLTPLKLISAVQNL